MTRKKHCCRAWSEPEVYSETNLTSKMQLLQQKQVFSLKSPSYMFNWILITLLILTEGALQRCSYKRGVLKICSKVTLEHPCRSVISMKLLINFIEITLRYGRSLVNLQHIFWTSFPCNTSEGLLLYTNKNNMLICIVSFFETWF